MFPGCIRINEVLSSPVNNIDIDKKVSKTYSADLCATKGNEEALEYHSAIKRVTWSWYTSTNECVINTFNDASNVQLEDLAHGICTYINS